MTRSIKVCNLRVAFMSARKGYGRSKLPREELIRRKPTRTYVRGVVGHVPNLFEVLDEALREKGWNWSTLAERAHYTRTYVIKLTESTSVPYDTLCRLCEPLGLDADDLIEPLPHAEATA